MRTNTIRRYMCFDSFEGTIPDELEHLHIEKSSLDSDLSDSLTEHHLEGLVSFRGMQPYDMTLQKKVFRFAHDLHTLHCDLSSEVFINENLSPKDIYLSICEDYEAFFNSMNKKFVDQASKLEIKFNYRPLEDSDFKTFSETLPESLSDLRLWSGKISDNIFEHLTSLSFVKNLKLFACGYTNIAECPAATRRYNIEILALKQSKITDEGYLNLLKSGMLENVENLDLNGNNIEFRLPGMKLPGHIRHLNLSVNKDLHNIASVLDKKNLDKLRSLHVSSGNIDNEQIDYILKNSENLRFLSTSHNNVSMNTLSRHSGNTDIEYLDISEIDNVGYFSHSIFSENLKVLKCSYNNANGSHLGHILGRCKNLRHLDISNTSDLEILPLDAIHENLEVLNLNGVDFSKSPRALDFLASLPNLKIIQLAHCELSDHHIESLRSQELKDLQILDLEGNNLTDKSLDYLARSSFVHHAHEINLSFNDIQNPTRPGPFHYDGQSPVLTYKGHWPYWLSDESKGVRWKKANYLDEYDPRTVFPSVYYDGLSDKRTIFGDLNK